MKFCQYCGQQLVDQAVVCIHCGCSTGPLPKKDKISIFLCILLGHCWVAALIYWAVKQKETPRRAKAVAISAILVPLAYFFLMMILLAGLAPRV